MTDLFENHFLLVFPIFFGGLWLFTTTVLGFMSGWYGLASRYPDRSQTPIRRFNSLGGTLGVVNMRGILGVAVCPDGLRISMWRLFGPFCRPFFVPWSELRIIRRNRILWQTAMLDFGNPRVGRLKIQSYIADKMARASLGKWPETGVFPTESFATAFFAVFVQWLVMTILAGLFFTLVPRLAEPAAGFPPVWISFLFPAVVFGIFSLPRFFARISR